MYILAALILFHLPTIPLLSVSEQTKPATSAKQADLGEKERRDAGCMENRVGRQRQAHYVRIRDHPHMTPSKFRDCFFQPLSPFSAFCTETQCSINATSLITSALGYSLPTLPLQTSYVNGPLRRNAIQGFLP